ncbi:hypothetical protein KCU89_g10625, partial [Aureobasidium melanogenum]
MSKAGAEVILKSLLNREIDVDALPWGPEDEKTPAGIETVIFANEVAPARGKKFGDVIIKTEDGEKEDVIIIKDEPED